MTAQHVVDPGDYYQCVHRDRLSSLVWAQAVLLIIASLFAAVWFVYNMTRRDPRGCPEHLTEKPPLDTR